MRPLTRAHCPPRVCVYVVVLWKVDGATPLLAAAEDGHTVIVDLLLKLGANINVQRVSRGGHV